MDHKLHPVMNIFILVVSICMVIFTTWKLYNLIYLKYNSNKADGVIVNYHSKEGEAKFRWNRKPVHAPVFSFKDEAGEEFNIITSNFKKRMKYKKGDNVVVYYNPDNPRNAEIDDSFPWTRYITILILGALGVYYTLLPILGNKS